MLDEMQKEAFTQSVNSEFQVIWDGSKAFNLKLTEDGGRVRIWPPTGILGFFPGPA